jgi:hypothetical protein
VAQVLIAVVLVAAALVVAAVVQRRRRPAGPTQPEQWEAPAQLDRADFARPDAPWLLVVFTSATCSSCADVVQKANVLADARIAVQEVEAGTQPALHQRYHIEAVPMAVLADADGVVREHFIGPVSAAELWAAVAEARQPEG